LSTKQKKKALQEDRDKTGYNRLGKISHRYKEKHGKTEIDTAVLLD